MLRLNFVAFGTSFIHPDGWKVGSRKGREPKGEGAERGHPSFTLTVG